MRREHVSIDARERAVGRAMLPHELDARERAVDWDMYPHEHVVEVLFRWESGFELRGEGISRMMGWRHL